MNEQDKERDRRLKRETVERLPQVLPDWEQRHGQRMDGTDRRILEYVRAVAAEPEEHNLYELLGVLRFMGLADRYAWNAARVRRFFRFYESLRFNGAAGRRSYRLTPVQTFQFASIFGFTDSAGLRLTRTAYIFVPRKYGKTTSMASLAVWDLLFGDHNAQAYVGANSYDQAKICFDEIRAIMRDIDPRERHFRVNREKITFKDGGRDSLIRCLTSNARTQDGLNASLVIMDEYAQARNTAGRNGADLKNVLTSSMGARREPLTVIITTASEVVDGPFAHELDGVKKVLRSEWENDAVFASIFEPDVDDREDDPATWRKVQPHMGITVRDDFYRSEYASALLSSENMTCFRTKMLNVFTLGASAAWFTYEAACRLCGDFDIDRVEGRPPCAVAFDLSVHDDFSAVSYTIYSEREKRFYCHTDYYFPAGCLQGHQNGPQYRLWSQQGHLKLCAGDCIDVEQIAGDILRRAGRLNIIQIGYDSYKAVELRNMLLASGAEHILKPYPQTYGNFNLPVESFEMMAYDSPPRIEMNYNPINVFCLCNCVIDQDRLENKKPIKASQYQKIDGTITMLMTIGMMFTYER